MPDTIDDPLTDPRVVAARARVTKTERTRERFADVTAETQEDGSTATMRIYGRIDSDGAPWGISAQEVADAVDALPATTGRLDVHIHSRGGDAFEGLAILNTLRQARPEVHVVVDGLAASAASAIAMAGKTVTMAPSSQLMIHDASGLCVGQAEDMRILAAALDSTSESYAAAYAARAGGTVEEWRAAMQPETWYRADEAVKAGLADAVMAKPVDEPKATASFDLSVFAHAGRDDAPDPFIPKPPAQPPEKHPHPKEDVTMTPEDIKALRERLGLAEDADASAINAKLDELEEQATKPADDLDEDKILAAVTKLGPDKAKTIVAKLGKSDDEPAVPEGKVLVSETLLEELKANATLGAEARAKQLEAERDEAIEAAFKAGKISAERRDTWRNAWDKDPAGTKADLDSLEARFPVGPTSGYSGHDGTAGDGAAFDDDEAAEMAALTGTRKEAWV